MEHKTLAQIKEEFVALLEETNREGIEDVLDFLEKSDFYTAPASTRYHSCHEGGLLEHSMNVYKCLMEKRGNATWAGILNSVEHDTIIISALLHDICKTYFYVPEYRNKKVYNENGKKIDEGGRFDWQVVRGYSVDDKMPLGHGEKSVMLLEKYIELKSVERYAIRWHMGFTEPKESWGTLSAAIEKYPFILALHEADLEATYLMESEE